MSARLGRRAAIATIATMASACSRRPPARDGGRTVASLWFSYGGKNREVLLDLVARFNESQARYLVRATYQGDYFEALAKLRAAIAAGVAPDVTHVVGEVVPYLASAGVLEPLDGYEGASTLDLVPELAQSGAYERGAARPLWGVPFNRSTPIAVANGALVPRGRAPTTWADLRAVARALTTRDARGEVARWGYEVPISWWFWVALVGQAGGTLLGPDGEPTLGGEAGEAGLRLWQTLVHDDRAMRSPPGRDYNAWQATNQDFLAGRVALIWTSTAFLRYLEENASFEVVASPLSYRDEPAVPTGGTFFVVMRGAPAEAREASWAFLRFMCGAEPAAEWAARTGYLPVTRGAVARLESRGFYASHPNDLVAMGQLGAVMPWPWQPSLFRIQREAVEPRLEAAVFSNRDAHATLDEARAAARAPG